MIAGGAVGASGSELRGALLLQPHGFEGVVRLLVEADADDLAITKREDESAARAHLDAIATALVRDVRDDDGLTSLDEAFGLDDSRLKGLVVALVESHGLVE